MSTTAALFLERLAAWAPTRLWVSLFFGALLAAPAAFTLATGAEGFLALVMWQDPVTGALTMGREGLSPRGFFAIGAGLLGALVIAQGVVAYLVRAATAPTDAGTSPSRATGLRIFVPGSKEPLASGADTTSATAVLHGHVRAAAGEFASPLAGAPCLLFGLAGDVDGAPVGDADGGDFDLELESGELVMVSLEHARLEAPDTSPPVEVVEPTDALEELLECRGIAPNPGAACRLREHRVHAGDRVSVEGRITGGKALSLGYRTPSRVRVVSGDASAPVIVRVLGEA